MADLVFPTVYPTRETLEVALDAAGYTLEDFTVCGIQGVLIRWTRPVRAGETFLGLQLAGPTTATEVIEYHYKPHDAPLTDEVMDVTIGRAIQRTLWDIEDVRREEAERDAAS